MRIDGIDAIAVELDRLAADIRALNAKPFSDEINLLDDHIDSLADRPAQAKPVSIEKAVARDDDAIIAV